MNIEDAKKRFSAVWGETVGPDIELMNETIHRLDLGKDSRLLDVGTGLGIMAITTGTQHSPLVSMNLKYR